MRFGCIDCLTSMLAHPVTYARLKLRGRRRGFEVAHIHVTKEPTP